MPSRHQGPARERRALDAYVKLMRAAHAVSHRIHEHLRADELTVGQFAVLEALLHLGPLAQRDLCTKLLVSGANLSVVVDNLERRAWVRRRRDPRCRRVVIVRLTPSGRRLVERVFPRHAQAVARDFAVLSAVEQAALGRLCRRLGRQQGARSAARSVP